MSYANGPLGLIAYNDGFNFPCIWSWFHLHLNSGLRSEIRSNVGDEKVFAQFPTLTSLRDSDNSELNEFGE